MESRAHLAIDVGRVQITGTVPVWRGEKLRVGEPDTVLRNMGFGEAG